ncbi:hypothetical protein HRbin04_00813 [archaeon HR04]|nr:hypothetical protein HRbin04_00813 [archaeon HR04]
MISSVDATVEVEDDRSSGRDRDRGSSSIVRSIYIALEPECRANSKGKDEGVETSIMLEDSRVRVMIHAKDVSTIRAVLNSYLRFIDAAYRSLAATKQ